MAIQERDSVKDMLLLNIISAFVCMEVCVNIMHALPHANIHVQVCVYYKSASFQTALLKRPGPERMAQLKTLVTDDISRDQTDSPP